MKLLILAFFVAFLATPSVGIADEASTVSPNNGVFDLDADLYRPPYPHRPDFRPRPRPRPHYGYFQCVAHDAGWEEHRGGHAATGYSAWQAQQQSLRLCQRFHGRCYVSQCYRLR
jgi:hypothetical protein